MATARPVTLLRESIIASTPPRLIRRDGSAAPDLRDAEKVVFTVESNPVEVHVSERAGYKDYTLLTLLFFAENRSMEQSAYLQKSLAFWSEAKKDVPSVSFIDRRELLEYLTGVISTSQHLTQSGAAETKDSETLSSTHAAPSRDYEFIKEMLEREISIVNIKNFLSAKATKAGAISPLRATYLTSCPKDVFIGHKVRRYEPTEDFIKRGDVKPSSITIERRTAGPGLPRVYEVIDSIDRLRSADWDRIVAVFATGQEWQFKNWKFGSVVDILAKVKGFCVKFSDEPTNEKIKNWNVTVLEVSLYYSTPIISTHC
ncbi:hypothetical protein HK405_009124 [Cladochytrium tenue]|nr:hypothetical protein HK405_009124 [Cladochytrium tenue]